MTQGIRTAKLKFLTAAALLAIFSTAASARDATTPTNDAANDASNQDDSANQSAAPTTPTFVGLTPQDVGVMDRVRPEYDAKGIPLGAWRLFPILKTYAGYDSNVFRIANGSDDVFLDVAPSARLITKWDASAFEVYAGADNYFYSKYTSENLTDWKVGSDARLNLMQGINAIISGSLAHLHEGRSSPNTIGFQKSPTPYVNADVQFSGSYQRGLIRLEVGGSFDRYDYLSVDRVGGGSQLVNSDRDMNEYQTYAKVSYDFSPGYSVYLRPSFDSRQYDQFLDRSGQHRSSDGYGIDAGLTMQLTHLIRGDIAVGYVKDNFTAPLKDSNRLDYAVQLDWFATQLLTVHLSGKQQMDQTTLTGVSVTEDSSITLSADYEFLRNVIVQAQVGYMNSSFVGSTRVDQIPQFGLGISYLLNRRFSLDLHYTYETRSTNLPSLSGFNYTDNLVRFGITLHE